MMDGYSVPETASVLGVPEGKVWELLARGVLSGAPEGDGMRVFLKENPAPMGSRGDRFAAPPANGGGASGAAEMTPFRELLTEFRNLTERYGQALLALGEARGEVAGLRSRVDLLEARLDLRLPGPGIVPPVTWERPTRPETETEPEKGVRQRAVDAAPAPVAEPTRRAPAPRRSRTARSAVAGFAEALARAQDPTTAEMPGVDDAARHAASVEEPGAAGPETIASTAAAEEIAIESSPAAVEVLPPPTEASASPSYTTDVIEPDWFADGDFAWLDAAEIEAQVAAPVASPEAAPSPEPIETQPEPEPEIQAYEAEPFAAEPIETQPEPEPEIQAYEAEPFEAEPIETQSEPEPEIQAFEAEPFAAEPIETPAFVPRAFEPEPVDSGVPPEASYLGSDIGPTTDPPQPESGPEQAHRDAGSTAVAVEHAPAPDVPPATGRRPVDEVDRAPDFTMEAAEPFHIGVGEPANLAPEWRRAPDVPVEPRGSAERGELTRAETFPETSRASVDEMEVAASAWREPVVAASPVGPVEDESLARLARQEGWDAAEVEAIRALVGQGALTEIVLPGADELDEAMAALNSGRKVAAPPSATEPPARQAVLTPPPAPGRQAPRQAPGDPAWLRGRRGPAATAFRRLRRLFTE